MRFLLSLSSLFGLLAALPCWGTEPQRPNIILFLVDDMGWQDSSLPFWRNEEGRPRRSFLNRRYRTPHMEQLAEQGMLFTRAYAQAICSPSRCSLLSGMNVARHGVSNWTLRCDESTDELSDILQAPDWAVNGLQPAGTAAEGESRRPLSGESFHYRMAQPYTAVYALPELLRRAGYRCIHCGKAHFGSKDTPGANPLNFGFDVNIAGSEIGGVADYRGSRRYGPKGAAFRVRGLDENKYCQGDVFLTEALTREAIAAMEAQRGSGQPFFLYMAHYAVHSPLDERAYDKRFAENYRDPQDGLPWTELERNYAALLEGMDKSWGDILRYLHESGLEEKSIVLFMSDNGGLSLLGRMGQDLANYPLSAGKGSLREGGIREPMMVRWPGVTRAGSVNDTPLLIEDFFPSLLEIAGASLPEEAQTVDGRSFVPALRGEAMDRERPLLFHRPNIWLANSEGTPYAASSALIVDDWKLIYRHADQSFELFRLSDDIREERNLAATETEQLRRMAREMTRLLMERGARMPSYKAGSGHAEGSPVPWPDEAAARTAQP